MVEVGLRMIERDVIKISQKICFHWHTEWTVVLRFMYGCRYADNDLLLIYKHGAVCHHNNFQRQTIIKFTCDPNAGNCSLLIILNPLRLGY